MRRPSAMPKDPDTVRDWMLNDEIPGGDLRAQYSRYFRLGSPFQRTVARTTFDILALLKRPFRRVLVKMKVQPQVLKAEELTSRHTTQIFGLAMTAVFVAMLILTAITY
jgi:hypothetical protein